jgi:hypothetical protein
MGTSDELFRSGARTGDNATRALMETIANEARHPTNAYPTDAEATYNKDG